MSHPENARPRLTEVLTDVSIREGSQQRVDLRDATPAVKLDLLTRIVRTGVKRIELTAFAPGAWFADAHELAAGAAAIVPAPIALRSLYFNTRGLQELLGHPRLLREGIFHTAATANYRQKNYGQRSTDHALQKMRRLIDSFRKNDLRFDTLVLSTAWGEPGEQLEAAQITAYLEPFLESAVKQGLPVQSLTLADTLGSADAGAVAKLIGAVKTAWPHLIVSAHLHSRPASAEDCIHAAIESGTDRWEAAWGGLGGSPYASDPGGNLDIRTLAKVYRKRGLDHGLSPEWIDPLIEFVKERTRRQVPDG